MLIETNHDEKLLQNDTKRPWSVKQRIMSRHGHLSNAAAAEVLAELMQGRLQRAVLGHLSRDCNSPELAVGTVRSRLDGMGANEVEVICAGQREISARMAVSRVVAATAVVVQEAAAVAVAIDTREEAPTRSDYLEFPAFAQDFRTI
jgi:hypothetical protein